MSEPTTGRPNQKHLQTKRWLLLNVLLLTVVGLLNFSYPVEEFSRRAGDLYFRLRGNKWIAEQHGGKAEVRGKSESGTSFRIHLPATRFILSETNQ
jgi:hypothetical protein